MAKLSDVKVDVEVRLISSQADLLAAQLCTAAAKMFAQAAGLAAAGYLDDAKEMGEKAREALRPAVTKSGARSLPLEDYGTVVVDGWVGCSPRRSVTKKGKK